MPLLRLINLNNLYNEFIFTHFRSKKIIQFFQAQFKAILCGMEILCEKLLKIALNFRLKNALNFTAKN